MTAHHGDTYSPPLVCRTGRAARRRPYYYCYYHSGVGGVGSHSSSRSLSIPLEDATSTFASTTTTLGRAAQHVCQLGYPGQAFLLRRRLAKGEFAPQRSRQHTYYSGATRACTTSLCPSSSAVPTTTLEVDLKGPAMRYRPLVSRRTSSRWRGSRRLMYPDPRGSATQRRALLQRGAGGDAEANDAGCCGACPGRTRAATPGPRQRRRPATLLMWGRLRPAARRVECFGARRRLSQRRLTLSCPSGTRAVTTTSY